MPLLLLPDGDRDALVTAAAVSGRSYGLLEAFLEPVRFLLPSLAPVSLTKREHVVLHALVSTSSTADLAASLFVSVNTVKSQLRTLYRKLGANSRDEALSRAAERGLIQG
jgi:LuxR family maltose regulon positive regulatory protein